MNQPPDNSCDNCGAQLHGPVCLQCGFDHRQQNPPPQQQAPPQQQPPQNQPRQQPPQNQPPQQAPRQQQHRQRPSGGGSSTLKTAALIVGGGLGAIFISMLVASFVLGLGQTDQAEAEETVEAFYQGIADGNEQQVLQQVHGDGPMAANLSDGSGSFVLRDRNKEVTLTESTVLTDEENRLVLEATLESDGFGEETEQMTTTVELRTEDGEWKIWQFLD